jgi:hypothetical protein
MTRWAVALLLVGCGPTSAQRTAYTMEITRCIANERAIVDRAGTTLEQDRADLTAERTRCDSALRALEGGQ